MDGKLTLDIAKILSNLIEQKADSMGIKVVIAVADEGGNLIYLERMNDAYIASIDIAIGKAFTSVSLKMPTRTLKQLAQPGSDLYGIQYTNCGKIIIFGGGEPLQYNDKVIGGIGVSGGTEEQDTALGLFGIEGFREILKCL